MGRSGLLIALVLALSTVQIRAQPGDLVDEGNIVCHNEGSVCGAFQFVFATPRACCVDLRREIYAEFSDLSVCFNCPVCYATSTTCGDVSDATGTPPSGPDDCCSTMGGASYQPWEQDEECMTCPPRPMCYTESADCGDTSGGAVTDPAPGTMSDCCGDGLPGMSYDDGAGNCVMCGGGMGDDPHFIVPLGNGEDMCYSLQGEAYFAFNLISDPTISINTYFIPPEDGQTLSDTATFLGDIGIMVKADEILTKIAISASDRSVLVDGSRTVLHDRHVNVVVGDNNAVVQLGEVLATGVIPHLTVSVKQPKLAFRVQFVREHLDLIVVDDSGICSEAHGIMGQFLHKDAIITEDNFLKVNDKKIRIEQQMAWDFIHTNTTCLHALPSEGIQAEGIIEGKYTDYIVEGLFSPEFEYCQFKQ